MPTGIPGVNASGDTRFDGVIHHPRFQRQQRPSTSTACAMTCRQKPGRDLANIRTARKLVLRASRRPAAVLYGRGSTTAASNRVSKVPRRAGSSVSAQVGSFDSRRFAADLKARRRAGYRCA